MKSSISGIWLLLVTLILAAMYLLSLIASRQGYGNLLLVTPSGISTPGLQSEKLEEFLSDEFLLTYEIRQPSVARAINSSHSITLVGTNHHYAAIMGYRLLDGGFFTQAAMDAKSRYVVLNEAAAFQMFGSVRVSGQTLKIAGEAWVVAGVIQDNDEEAPNLYAPASATGGQAGSIMALMDETVTEAYAKNALKGIGVHESGYEFINLSKSAAAFGERFAVACQIALLALILLFAVGSGGRLMGKLRFYRGRLRDLYLSELLLSYRMDFIKTAVGIILLAAGGISGLALSLQILGTCLTWQELAFITGELAAGDFGHRLFWLRDYQGLGVVLFRACVCVILIGLFIILAARAKGCGKKRVKAGHMAQYPILYR